MSRNVIKSGDDESQENKNSLGEHGLYSFERLARWAYLKTMWLRVYYQSSRWRGRTGAGEASRFM